MNAPTMLPAGDGLRFWLGTHQPGWLSRVGVPLFVSDRRLRDRRRLAPAVADLAVDSGGFTELQQYGTWTVTPGEYVARLRRYTTQTGRMVWAAPQDWMFTNPGDMCRAGTCRWSRCCGPRSGW